MPCHGSQYIKGFVIVIVAAEDVEVVFVVWGSNPAWRKYGFSGVNVISNALPPEK